MQKPISRTAFAKLANVSASTVTRAADSELKPAKLGQRIDAAHPAAVKFIQDHDPANTDPMLLAARKMVEAGENVTANQLRQKLGVGAVRAKRIMEEIQVKPVKQKPTKPQHAEKKPATQASKKPKPTAQAKETAPQPYIRGTAARKAKRKVEHAGREDELIEVPEDIQAFGHMTLFELVEKFGTDLRFADWLKATQTIEVINEKRLKNAQTRGELVSRELVRKGVLDHVEAAHVQLLSDGSKTITRRVIAMHDAGRTIPDIEIFVVDQMSSFIKPMKARINRALRDV